MTRHKKNPAINNGDVYCADCEYLEYVIKAEGVRVGKCAQKEETLLALGYPGGTCWADGSDDARRCPCFRRDEMTAEDYRDAAIDDKIDEAIERKYAA